MTKKTEKCKCLQSVFVNSNKKYTVLQGCKLQSAAINTE